MDLVVELHAFARLGHGQRDLQDAVHRKTGAAARRLVLEAACAHVFGERSSGCTRNHCCAGGGNSPCGRQRAAVTIERAAAACVGDDMLAAGDDLKAIVRGGSGELFAVEWRRAGADKSDGGGGCVHWRHACNLYGVVTAVGIAAGSAAANAAGTVCFPAAVVIDDDRVACGNLHGRRQSTVQPQHVEREVHGRKIELVSGPCTVLRRPVSRADLGRHELDALIGTIARVAHAVGQREMNVPGDAANRRIGDVGKLRAAGRRDIGVDRTLDEHGYDAGDNAGDDDHHDRLDQREPRATAGRHESVWRHGQ
ncbi:MAG: hypothetical protein A2W75_06960 [Nitrospinae bacterium RIFCSPLOWO2_12_39_15]|nr:MAG: hypothetical protein A2W75_06960 [Nitrospinae bacterium RIFCSPLOWO2_12_39_15]